MTERKYSHDRATGCRLLPSVTASVWTDYELRLEAQRLRDENAALRSQLTTLGGIRGDNQLEKLPGPFGDVWRNELRQRRTAADDAAADAIGVT